MLFNSWEFAVLLAVTFALYYAPWSVGRHGKAWQVIIALAASVVFYGWEDPQLVGLLAVSCVGNSIATARIILHNVAGNEPQVKHWTRLAVILNLALLAVFKYAGFVAGMLPFLPEGWVRFLKEIPLPIGISFYTFHGISMIVDVARGEVTREGDTMLSRGGRFAKGVRDIGFYLLFFPQLVAGPIVKAKQFWPQIAAKRFADIPWQHVIRTLIFGYFLKVFVADNLSEQTAFLSQPGNVSQLSAASPFALVPLLYAYCLQIFADFGGYSLIAIGLAALFGYRFPENFNFPYLSSSITEFWRRWHMSLSAWLRDYLYIPLGGNRKGEGWTYVNLFLVMFLGGLWHGAEWKFALWGTLHGLLLAAERFLSRRRGKLVDAPPSRLRFFFGTLYTFHAVTLLWLTFLMPDLAHIRAFFKGVGSGNPAISGPPFFCLLFYGTWVVLYHAWGWLREHRSDLAAKFAHPAIEGGIHALMLFLLVTNPGAPRGFIYFQF
jgi:alginate O-acetyltransferase complex protein AlgI